MALGLVVGVGPGPLKAGLVGPPCMGEDDMFWETIFEELFHLVGGGVEQAHCRRLYCTGSSDHSERLVMDEWLGRRGVTCSLLGWLVSVVVEQEGVEAEHGRKNVRRKLHAAPKAVRASRTPTLS